MSGRRETVREEERRTFAHIGVEMVAIDLRLQFGVSIVTTSAHFAASATSITLNFSRSAFFAETDPVRSATATLETPESRKLSAWAWPWLP